MVIPTLNQYLNNDVSQTKESEFSRQNYNHDQVTQICGFPSPILSIDLGGRVIPDLIKKVQNNSRGTGSPQGKSVNPRILK